MKTSANTYLVFLAVALAVVGLNHSGRAQEMNYQGRLTDSNGDPLADGQYKLTFSLWDAATGGFMEWGPFIADGTGATGHGPFAEVVNGRFNVVIGPNDVDGRRLGADFGGDLYLELKVGDNNPITPRQKLLYAPLALHSETAVSAFSAAHASTAGHADTADEATTALNFASDADLFVNGSGFFGGDSGALPDSFGKGIRAFYDSGSGVAQILAHDYGTGNPLPLQLQQSGGNVGIGTAPDANRKLHVNGDMLLRGRPLSQGLNATLTIEDGTGGTMAIDGSEINSLGLPLRLNQFSATAIIAHSPLTVAVDGLAHPRSLILSSTYQQMNSTWYFEIDADQPEDPDIFFWLQKHNATGLMWGGAIDGEGAGFINPSDRALKQDIEPLNNSLGTALGLKPRQFRWKSNPTGPPRMGFIAQEVEEVAPALVSENGELKGLNYSGFGVVAIGAIQELNAKVETLEAEKAALNERLSTLESQLGTLLERVPQ